MIKDKLQPIIDAKNASLERKAVNIASSIIDEIAELQCEITAANDRIILLRGKLNTLQIEQIDSASILG